MSIKTYAAATASSTLNPFKKGTQATTQQMKKFLLTAQDGGGCGNFVSPAKKKRKQSNYCSVFGGESVMKVLLSANNGIKFKKKRVS